MLVIGPPCLIEAGDQSRLPPRHPVAQKPFARTGGSEKRHWPISRIAHPGEGFAPAEGRRCVEMEGDSIRRALPHGHAAAVGTSVELASTRCSARPDLQQRRTPLAIALIASRLVSLAASKLATSATGRDTAVRAWAACEDRTRLDEVEKLYRASDWLGERQPPIETAIARRHIKDGA